MRPSTIILSFSLVAAGCGGQTSGDTGAVAASGAGSGGSAVAAGAGGSSAGAAGAAGGAGGLVLGGGGGGSAGGGAVVGPILQGEFEKEEIPGARFGGPGVALIPDGVVVVYRRVDPDETDDAFDAFTRIFTLVHHEKTPKAYPFQSHFAGCPTDAPPGLGVAWNPHVSKGEDIPPGIGLITFEQAPCPGLRGAGLGLVAFDADGTPKLEASILHPDPAFPAISLATHRSLAMEPGVDFRVVYGQALAQQPAAFSFPIEDVAAVGDIEPVFGDKSALAPGSPPVIAASKGLSVRAANVVGEGGEVRLVAAVLRPGQGEVRIERPPAERFTVAASGERFALVQHRPFVGYSWEIFDTSAPAPWPIETGEEELHLEDEGVIDVAMDGDVFCVARRGLGAIGRVEVRCRGGGAPAWFSHPTAVVPGRVAIAVDAKRRRIAVAWGRDDVAPGKPRVGYGVHAW